MAAITFKDRSIDVAEGQSVLEALLAAGEAHPHSCKTGACQACVARACSVAPPTSWQTGLSEPLKARGFFLTCQATSPPQGLEVATADDLPRFSLRVNSVSLPASNIAVLHFQSDQPLAYEPGQFIQLSREDGLTRSYSLASVPADGQLELHVRRVPGGAMSEHLHAATQGHTFTARGPGGNCFYVAGRPEQTLILAGTGTGLAPLLGIARHALAEGHTGPITLIHGALSSEGLYASPRLQTLAKQHENFKYVGCVKEAEEASDDLHVGDVSALVLQLTKATPRARFFLCGPPDLVNGLRKQVFLAGANLRDILADAFVMAAPAGGTAPAIVSVTDGG